MGNNGRQAALNALVKMRDFNTTNDALINASKVLLNPTLKNVNEIIKKMQELVHDPKSSPIFNSDYSNKVFTFTFALRFVTPELGEGNVFRFANLLVGVKDENDLEAGDYVMHFLDRRADRIKVYEQLIDNARKLINLMPSRSEDVFQEEKSIKRFEMRLYKLKKTYKQ